MRTKTAGNSKPAPPPTAHTLREAALDYLARFASTEAGLARVLERRVERWARAAIAQAGIEPGRDAAVEQARACIPKIVSELAATGAVSDAAFAEARARALVRSGRSRRAIGAHLAARGVPPALSAGALPADPGQELAAALIHARKRRLGPWRKEGQKGARAGAPLPDILRREMGSFARAGFAHQIAAQVLAYGQDEAEAVIATFRADL